jgi:prophage regulatory protein
MSGQLRGNGAILRRSQVEHEVGLKRSTIYQRMQEGTFPRPIRLGERAVGWRASDIELFLEDPAGYRASRFEDEISDA